MFGGSETVIRRVARVALLAAAVTVGMCVAVVGAQAAEPVGQVTLFRSGLDPGSNAIGLTPSPDGTLWFSDWFNNKLGRITTDGRITEQAGPAGSFAVGYDGNMWFPYGNRGVARLTTDGRFTLFPAAGITVTAVAAGADGNIWFTDTQNNAIGRLTPAGRITEFTFGLLAGSRPSAITAGPNATIWFTDTACSQRGQCAIGVISTITGHITEFPSSGTREFGYPQAIAAGGDGNMWFSDAPMSVHGWRSDGSRPEGKSASSREAWAASPRAGWPPAPTGMSGSRTTATTRSAGSRRKDSSPSSQPIYRSIRAPTRTGSRSGRMGTCGSR